VCAQNHTKTISIHSSAAAAGENDDDQKPKIPSSSSIVCCCLFVLLVRYLPLLFIYILPHRLHSILEEEALLVLNSFKESVHFFQQVSILR
jgi:hypothetical protein